MALHFLRPYWFFAILPVVFLCWRLARSSLVDNWRLVCDEHLLAHLWVNPKRKINFPLILLALGSLMTVLALSGPSWEKETQPVYRAMLGRVLVLNLSPSMADLVGTAKKIDRARFKLLDFLARQKEGMTGLVVYTDEAHTISPLTEDNRTIANFIPALDPSIMPTFKDDTRIGMQEAGQLFKQGGLASGHILLITDKITHFSAAKKVASDLYQKGYRLFILDLSGQDVNLEMKKLAAVGGGKVIPLAPNNQDIDALVASTQSLSIIPPTRKTKEKGVFWHDNGRVIIFFILPLALLAFRRGYL
jgi:Ca-activated chloride channel family protein